MAKKLQLEMKTYQLEINEKHARVLSLALEVLSRIHIEQFGTALELAFKGGKNMNFDNAAAIEVFIKSIIGSKYPRAYSGPGIHNEEVNDDARIAWDLQKVIDHCYFSEYFQYWYDKPYQSSKEPLAQMKVKE